MEDDKLNGLLIIFIILFIGLIFFFNFAPKMFESYSQEITLSKNIQIKELIKEQKLGFGNVRYYEKIIDNDNKIFYCYQSEFFDEIEDWYWSGNTFNIYYENISDKNIITGIEIYKF